jgi:hypothetical protein
MSSSKSAVVSKRSATTTPTVGPTKAISTTKKDVSSKPCKLCQQDTILAAPTVKRKGDAFYNATVSSSTPGTSDGRKIGENKLLSKANKSTKYAPSQDFLLNMLTYCRFSPYGGVCESCHGRTNRAGAKFCHACAYQKGCCVHGKKILDTSGYKQTTK